MSTGMASRTSSTSRSAKTWLGASRSCTSQLCPRWATDLAYGWTKPGQPLVISSMLSLGDGKWELVQNHAVTPSPVVDTASIGDFRVVDLDGDGKQEIVFFNKVDPDQAATMVVWNRY